MAPKKQQKMSIGDFLADQSLGSWADEMEDAPAPASAYRPGGGFGGGASSGGFGSDRPRFESREPGFAREQLPLPTRPPFTAHLGNLSFEVTKADVEDFLSGCEVTNVRIIEDKMDQRPKGFGYVEFGSVDGLKRALELSESQFQGRNIRITVADPPKNDREPMREITDWTRKGPLPDLPGQQQTQRRGSDRGNFNRFDSNASDAGSDRAGRRPFFEGDGKVRDFGNWERKGPLTPTEPAAPRGGERGSMREPRRRSPAAWGEGAGAAPARSDAGSRPPRREFSERPPPVERAPTAADMDNQWRSRMKPDAPSPVASPEVSSPTSPVAPAAAAAPATRPRLNLAKRTVSEAVPAGDASAAGAGAASDSKASPFGAARPIDTTAREREIEEKRQMAIRSKKEQDEKSREEKRAARERDNAANKTDKVTSPGAEKAEPKYVRQPNENGKVVKDEVAGARQYEILRRAEGDAEAEDVESDPVDREADANGTILADKDVKPQEVTREIPVAKATDSWRKAPQPESTAEAVEDEGWSTVPAKGKGNSSRRGGGRALAS